jgi:peroxiredoxin
MALTPSTMLDLGSPAPGFQLRSTEGALVGLDDFADARALLVMFLCNHCPYVKHITAALAQLGRDYQGSGAALVAINSNDADAYPDDNFEAMVAEKAARGYVFPYLFDEDQRVAHAYRAACTPDFFLFDAQRRLVYRGQLDDTRPTRVASGVYDSRQQPPHGRDLRAALDAALQGRAIPPEDQRPSIGCNIKWKPGNEPAWWGQAR